MCGLDIVDHWDLEFKTFLDHEKFHADYIESDILRLDSSPKKRNRKWISFGRLTFYINGHERDR
ncbi:uncharacterized protein EAE98_003081 [Botrytis deweyae]|uniref:Uncharacterized protein n=1 Tax=Botrytis deweyae TaxID=2478750 RepID=A0ABQ7IVX1_9HELO|nr:uncharacterized protein EAE98_003081 [Botrytis deweyae]KAF7935036.1 hypothetical protein EAE98_003081 [Botrytis deweyae]